MSPLRRAAAFAVLATLALAGCGGSHQPARQAVRAASADSPAAAAPVTTAPAAATAALPSAAGAPGKVAAVADRAAPTKVEPKVEAAPPPQPPPTATPDSPAMKTAPPPDPERDNKPLPLTVDAPSCATLGSKVPVTITTEPDTDFGRMIQFPDGKTYGTEGIGTTDQQGKYTTTLTITPDAPLGTAHLYVAAGGGSRGASNDHPITIKRAGC